MIVARQTRSRLLPHYSLRLLLAAVTAAAGVLAFWRAYVYPYRVQIDAMQVFGDCGGTVVTRPAGPGWLRPLLGEETMQTIVRVDLANCPVTDDCLAWLRRLPDLEEFRVGTSTPGVAIPTIERTLDNAEYLNLMGTRVTDAGLRHLAHCRQLETLFLQGTRVTNDGLHPLKELPSLRFVWLEGTQVTAEGARDLRRALPQAFVGN
jgi:hypothetical protein